MPQFKKFKMFLHIYLIICAVLAFEIPHVAGTKDAELQVAEYESGDIPEDLVDPFGPYISEPSALEDPSQDGGYITVPVWRSIYDVTRNKTDDPAAIAVRAGFILDWRSKWPKARVPYRVDPRFNQMQMKRLMKGMSYLAQVSCVRWVPARGERNYVYFTLGSLPCRSMVGMIGGRQDITYAPDCFTPRYGMSVEHEMLHALGFIHEQQRLDRDCYIWLRNDYARTLNYQKMRGTDQSFPYDYDSIMQYPQTQFMRPRRNGKMDPDMVALTALDQWALNTMYCGRATYCKERPRDCARMESFERNCK